MATLGAVAPGGPVGVTRPSATAGGPPDATDVPTVVVAGAPGCGKSSVTNALLGVPTPAPAAGLVPVAGATGGAVAAGPDTSAYVSYRHGDAPMAYAYVPGRRAPRPLGAEQVRAGDAAVMVRGGLGRPPRRVEVLHPAEMLRRVSLVDTPGVGGFDRVYAEIVLDALDRRAALLFVTEASTALQPAQLDFLAQVEQREVPVIFALAKIDADPQWPAVLSANQRLVHDHAPALACAPWYAVSTRYGCDGAPPAAPEEAARGLAGLGIEALRRALTEPPPGEPALPAQRTPAPAAQHPPAPRVAAGVTDERWTEILDSEIHTHGAAVGERLAVDLAAIHARCVQATASLDGCARLAYLVDRELHALSVRATRSVDAAAMAIMRRTFTEILQSPPDRAALERIRRATRRAVEDAEGGAPDWNRVLLVTSTSGIAVTRGRGAVAGLAAVAPRPIDDELLPPMGVGLSAVCYSARHRDSDRTRCREWLRQATQTLEIDLGRELAQRFGYLRDALAVVALDTVEHGVLLA
jgi:hypothetical protein